MSQDPNAIKEQEKDLPASQAAVMRFPPLPRQLDQLSPCGARLCLEVRRFLREAARLASSGPSLSSLPPLPETGEGVVVAFSGGTDSTALTLVLRCLGLMPVLVHLDHALRPESAAEARHAAAFAAALDLPAHIRRVDVAALAKARRCGLEEAGREARYALLEEVRRELGLTWIATGHQLDDLAEDMLLRLVRGAGWPALAGMQALHPERRLLRPLLGFRKARLAAWLAEIGLPPCEDLSNADLTFRRNRLRHQVLPLLEAENPAFVDKLPQLWTQARHDESYWQQVLAAPLDQARPTEQGWFLPRAVLAALHPAARLRLCLALVRRCGKGQGSAAALLGLEAALASPQGPKRFQLPGGLEIRLEREGVHFTIS